MNKVNAKIKLLFKFSSYSFSHFNNGISCILFEAYPAFRCNSSLRGSASLHSGIFSTIRARVEVDSINDRRKKLLSKEQKPDQQKNNPQKTKSAGK
jgi:hypothetical protein